MRYSRFIDSGNDEQNDFNLEVDRLWQWLARLLPRIAQWHLDILARVVGLCGLCQRRRHDPQPPPQQSARRQQQAQPKPSTKQRKNEAEARRKEAAKRERALAELQRKQVLAQLSAKPMADWSAAEVRGWVELVEVPATAAQLAVPWVGPASPEEVGAALRSAFAADEFDFDGEELSGPPTSPALPVHAPPALLVSRWVSCSLLTRRRVQGSRPSGSRP
jgi:hypothetical protein